MSDLHLCLPKSNQLIYRCYIILLVSQEWIPSRNSYTITVTRFATVMAVSHGVHIDGRTTEKNNAPPWPATAWAEVHMHISRWACLRHMLSYLLTEAQFHSVSCFTDLSLEYSTLSRVIWISVGMRQQMDRHTHRQEWPIHRSYNRCFSAAGPRLWNDLPPGLRRPGISFDSFKRSLKTHLFATEVPSDSFDL